MTNFDAALMQQVLYIVKREWKPHIEHYRKADDLVTGFEVSKWTRFGHNQTLRDRLAGLNQVFL
ncbi:hypothetical protein [Hoeflea sp. TYP-13]|uniref:hypothetical protein n=1 Tax=Hoeflea sp. TYP-13 TaxID=3230023 RepID=UPI0034C5FC73